MQTGINGKSQIPGTVHLGKNSHAAGEPEAEPSYAEPFEFDATPFPGTYGWYRNETDGTSRRIGSFDIMIHSKIIRYSPETLKWDETYYECQVMWLAPETNKERSSEFFILEPEDLLSKKAFQVQIFTHSYQSARFKSDDEILFFMSFLCNRWQPRTVYEFDYYGFVEHHGTCFYLTRNALVTIRSTHGDQPQHIIAPEAGSGLFPLMGAGSDFYVKPGRIEPSPVMDLEDPENGYYASAEKQLFTEKELRIFTQNVREKFGELVAGQQPDKKSEG